MVKITLFLLVIADEYHLIKGAIDWITDFAQTVMADIFSSFFHLVKKNLHKIDVNEKLESPVIL
jgi:hypothetical protein